MNTTTVNNNYSRIHRVFSITALAFIYSLSILIAIVFGKLVRYKTGRKGIIINGTFHNPNWFFSHIEPLTKSSMGPVTLICDEPIADLDNLTTICPPNWANKVFSRAGAKAIWTFIVSIKNPSCVHIGYHIFPSAITSLICARIFGSKAVYQVTSGQLELEGGGWNAENKLLVKLQKPSKMIEYFALKITGLFDLVVVRGTGAKKFLRCNGLTNKVQIVTGSVEINNPYMSHERPIDIIMVGRLTEYKRPDRFLSVIREVTNAIPGVNVSIVGDGPDKEDLIAMSTSMKLEKNITFLGQRSDVPKLVGKSKVFVLTSRWEGVSIAMLEAMGLGTVPIVSDVGDLKDFAKDDITGFSIPENDINLFANKIVATLQNDELRERLSAESMKLVEEKCSKKSIYQKWSNVLSELTR